MQTGRPVEPERRLTSSSGNGLMRPLEAAAKKAGVEILLEQRMTALYRDEASSQRVLGVAVRNAHGVLNVRARKATVIATGGSTGNVNFRRMFDPRLTDEYCGLAGMPWSNQDASGELAAMAIGASLWGAYNQTGEFGETLTKPGLIGTQYGYRNLRWMPGSEVFAKVGATGLPVGDWQNLVLVNLLGKRFYDETAGNYTSNSYGRIDPYTHYSYLNSRGRSSSRTGGSLRRSPGSVTATTAAGRSGPSSTPTRCSARSGTRRRRTWTASAASSSAPRRSRTWPPGS